MALTVDFDVTQPVGEPSEVTLEDTSTGSDGTITARRVYFNKYDGDGLVEEGTTTDYEDWPLAETTKTFDLLDKDYALNIIVQWLAGSTVVYQKAKDSGLTSYNEDFDYGLTQKLSGNPLLIDDNKFFYNKSLLRTEIDSGDQAILRAGDIAGAQQCYDRATAIRLNASSLFNIFSSS